MPRAGSLHRRRPEGVDRSRAAPGANGRPPCSHHSDGRNRPGRLISGRAGSATETKEARWDSTSTTSHPRSCRRETRTFARLCASLTEEAEAIGWYEQRLAVEPDADARAIMSDAQGEEFKHFAMDLEFLLRRTPALAADRRRRPLPGRRHRRARRGRRGRLGRGRRRRGRRPGRPTARSESAASRGRSDEPPAAPPGADLRCRLGAARRRGARAPAGPAGGAPAGRLRRPARLAALGDQPRPHRADRLAGGRRRHRRAAPGPAAGRAAGRVLGLPRRAGDNDRGAVDADLEPLDEAAQRIAVAENVAVFHGWAKAGIAGIAEASPVEAAAARRQRRGLPALGRPRGRGAARGRGGGPLRSRPRPRRVHPGDRDRRARRLPAVRPPGEDPRRARSSGRRG